MPQHKRFMDPQNRQLVDAWSIENPGSNLEPARLLHRLDGPARITYYDDEGENVSTESWWTNGEQGRLDGPSDTIYNLDGTILTRMWTYKGKGYRSFEKWLATCALPILT